MNQTNVVNLIFDELNKTTIFSEILSTSAWILRSLARQKLV